MLPLTRDQLVSGFVHYNQAVWPAPAVAYLLGLAMVIAQARPSRIGDRIIVSGH